jgi:hypothetical protein
MPAVPEGLPPVVLAPAPASATPLPASPAVPPAASTPAAPAEPASPADSPTTNSSPQAEKATHTTHGTNEEKRIDLKKTGSPVSAGADFSTNRSSASSPPPS